MYFDRFQDHLYDESAFSRFEINTKSLYKNLKIAPTTL